MENILTKQKLNYERFNAFNGKDEKEKCNEYLKKIKSTFCKNKQNKDGNIGCFLSHMKVLELIKEQKEGIYLVLEDDIKFHSNWKKGLKKILNKYTGVKIHSITNIHETLDENITSKDIQKSIKEK